MTSIVAPTASSTASIRVARAPASARGVARGCARVNARHASKRPSVRMKMAIEAETVSVESEKVTAFYADQMVDEAGMLAQSTFPIAPEDLIAKCKLILAALDTAFFPDDAPRAVEILRGLTGAGRFAILTMCLDKADTKAIASIFAKLESAEQDGSLPPDAGIAALKKQYA